MLLAVLGFAYGLSGLCLLAGWLRLLEVAPIRAVHPTPPRSSPPHPHTTGVGWGVGGRETDKVFLIQGWESE